MEIHEAAALIAGAMPPRRPGEAVPATWADLGAGTGTFTSALVWLLGQGATVIAVDRDPLAVAALRQRVPGSGGGAVVVAQGDFADPRGWDALALPPLDGIVLANALHFVPAGLQGMVLARLADALRPGGRLVVVEYEGRVSSQWVPHPVSCARLQALRPAACTPPRVLGMRLSTFGGSLYAALLERVAEVHGADDVHDVDEPELPEDERRDG